MAESHLRCGGDITLLVRHSCPVALFDFYVDTVLMPLNMSKIEKLISENYTKKNWKGTFVRNRKMKN